MDSSDLRPDWNGSEIGIIGMAGRFPGASNLAEFWENLCGGVESIEFFGDGPEDVSGDEVRAAPVIEGEDLFDASFFGLTPREAEVMDPQQRLFLECCWQALELSGYDPARVAEAIGVFAGARTNTYLLHLLANRGALGSLDAFEVGLGNDLAFLSSRVAYKLDLKGPALSVHTACSTGLVAVHLARQSLLIGECQMALAGAVAINVPQRTPYRYTRGGIVSPDGHCRPFDARAEGTIFGNGVGVVVLKRLQDALADGDVVHAVLRGTAINNDGVAKASFTAPAVRGQTEVILDALADAGVEPETLSYVEAHGTGTGLGDPIEVRALDKAFNVEGRGVCGIGSVKGNIGHLDAAAGIASLIKTTLALEHKKLPPTAHFETPNPKLELEHTPFYVVRELTPWEDGPQARRAGVSSFGVGGTNAHVILEEAPPRAASGDSRPGQLLPLSAKSGEALETMTSNLADHLDAAAQPLADVAYTLSLGRQQSDHRRVVVCSSTAGAVAALRGEDPSSVIDGFRETGEPPVVFLFPGQGSQYPGMGQDLYAHEPTYRAAVDRCAEILKPLLSCDLREALMPSSESTPPLSETWITQPALFTVGYALAELWKEWGIQPEAMIGHSVGEYVAACLAGVFSLEEALPLVAERGRLLQEQPTGGMLAVTLSEEGCQELLSAECSLAAVNGPQDCVLSGSEEAVAALEEELERRGVEHRRLHTSHAFHSHLMEPAVAGLVEAFQRCSLRPPEIPVISNVSGTWLTPEEATDPAYWGRQLRQTVRFSTGAGELLGSYSRVFLELGPGQTLSRLLRRHREFTRGRLAVASLPAVKEKTADREVALRALGSLWAHGVAVSWEGFFSHEKRRRVVLPTYPFARQRFWVDGESVAAGAASVPRQRATGKQADVGNWFYLPSWKTVPEPDASEAEPAADATWLVLSSDEGLPAELTEELRRSGKPLVTALPGERFERLGEGKYRLRPGVAEDYTRLLQEMEKEPVAAVHLWSLSSPNPPGSEGETASLLERGYYSLLFLCRALTTRSSPEPVKVLVASDGVVNVGDGEEIRPEKAPILSPCKVVPQEEERISLRFFDLRCPSTGLSRWLAGVVRDFAGAERHPVVAYRGMRRLVQTFEPAYLRSGDGGQRALRPGGVYLLTGGLGGVGLLVAEYLARTYQACLVLTARSSFPAPGSWDAWLESHAEESETRGKILQMRGWQEAGATIVIERADASDPEQMRGVMERIDQRFGALHGVLHVAGITSGPSLYRSFREIGKEESEAQFGPKLYGLYALEEALGEREVDFCLLFSSNAAVLGGLGYMAYTAANLFMDAFAAQRSATTGRSWISANWDAWPEETKKYSGLETALDRYTMTTEEACDAIERLVARGPDGQVLVPTGDLEARLGAWIERTEEQRASGHRRTAKGDYVAPRNDVERRVAAIWQEILGVDEVGAEDNFFDLGGHSLLATRLMARLNAAFGVELALGKFFEAPTVEATARSLEDLENEAVDEDRLEILKALAEISDDDAMAELARLDGEGG